MINFKGSRETLVSHQTNHFLVEQKKREKRETEMISTGQHHRVLNYKENNSVTLEVSNEKKLANITQQYRLLEDPYVSSTNIQGSNYLGFSWKDQAVNDWQAMGTAHKQFFFFGGGGAVVFQKQKNIKLQILKFINSIRWLHHSSLPINQNKEENFFNSKEIEAHKESQKLSLSQRNM